MMQHGKKERAPDDVHGRSEVSVVLAAPPELKVGNRAEFSDKIMAASTQFRHVVIDFADCKGIDPASLGVLIRVHRLLSEKGCTLTFARCGSELQTLFALTRMTGFFNIRTDDVLEPRIN